MNDNVSTTYEPAYETIVIDTGAKNYALFDKEGQLLGKFKFHPSDTRILSRYEKVVNFFNSTEFQNAVNEDETAQKIVELDKKICEQFDFLLCYPVSKGLFEGCGPMSPTEDGDLYFEKVLEAIAGVIESTTSQRIQKKLEKVSKATAKYDKR